ncbi:MAG: hypothetical protein KY468_06265 [Armatimonadetes bacterium]|nr:hypothetical protein [Armatimonadota bacterium]
MDNTVLLDSTPKGDAEYEAAIDHLLDEMKRLREQMADDQHEIERLRAETRASLALLKTP